MHTSPPPRFRVLCPPRAGVDTRFAWPGVDSKRLARALGHESVNRVALRGRGWIVRAHTRACPYALRNLDGSGKPRAV